MTVVDGLRSPAAGAEALMVRPWPVIAAEEREIARIVADAVIAARGAEPASVAHEERLAADVRAAVDVMVATPARAGLPLTVVSELARNRDYRDVTERNAAILASHLWPLSLLIYGAELENISCLGHDEWMVGVVGRRMLLRGASPFASDEECIEFFRRVIRLRGVTGDQVLTDAAPIAEANLGSVVRLCVAKRPAVSGRAAIKAAVRIPSRARVRDLDDYVTHGIMPPGAAHFLAACVQARVNILVAGGTSTGKTTLLRVLCGMTEESDHLVVVEDGAELHLDQDRGDGRPWHALTSAISTIPSVRVDSENGQVTMFDLVRHALRLQPDRLVLGESRGEEMAAVCKALMTGHDGSMTTIHAEDADLALDQAVQYVMENRRFSGNEAMARRVVEHAVHLVAHLANRDGRRRLTGILAVERGGNHRWIYRQADGGGLTRRTEHVADLHRLGPRLRHAFADGEVPPP
ncbi:MAG: ATPase, T2SS/T4P/T4SS family [Candidatus Dormibacteria bacterium]